MLAELDPLTPPETLPRPSWHPGAPRTGHCVLAAAESRLLWGHRGEDTWPRPEDASQRGGAHLGPSAPSDREDFLHTIS